MPTPPIEAEVIDLIARERGLPHHKVALSSRLLQDLGMDGDDAVEFFQDFEKRYGADLAPLYLH
jgi:acyl carrier protein